MIAMTDPSEARKAAAFVEALAGIEDKFDFRLDLGKEPIRFNAVREPMAGGAFAVGRTPDGDLVFGFAADPIAPRFPIEGR